ncbi:gephyrin-like molybdotransferase Glp [Streptomyces cavernae]|uniref:molybdopterin molybdotransferase MoeA n=1 Tax=Streptomyces cavernae TaxID=2259034 RepID=UPI000FEC088A|nr:gephyrin-like molybdotransferase Glp [Streptomyces cavernae]
MTGLEEARETILSSVSPLGAEVVAVPDVVGRVLASDQFSPWDLPMWDNSAMDGYAVRAADCQERSVLPVRGFLPAGKPAVDALEPGQADRILTGAPLPAGADAVVPFELTEAVPDGVRLLVRPAVGDHVRKRGGDLRAGQAVLTEGRVLGPAEVAVLAATGRSTVPVVRRPRVAVLSTGDELLVPGEPLRDGRIHDSNGPALAAAALRTGVVPTVLPIARDHPDDLRRSLETGLRADVLVTSAGVSAGDRDLVREVLGDLGAKEAFWQVDIQPGRPMAFATNDTCRVFALPGNPVAALLTFEVFVRPALRRMLGHRRPVEPLLRARLEEDVRPRANRVTLRRVRLERTADGLVATSAGRQATGFVTTLARADGIAFIPRGEDVLTAGTRVDVQPLRAEADFTGEMA